MGKNVIVVDEQGNEYEATYPKRAKGLVKSGRARFVDENKICLACPPNINLEDKNMSENKEAQIVEMPEKALTEIEIFNQIAKLQSHLLELGSCSMNRLSDSLSSVFDNGEFSDDEKKRETVSEITTVFSMREENVRIMLEFYKEMYKNCSRRKSAQEEKIFLIKEAFSDITSSIEKANLETQDRYAALCDITDKISDLVSQVIR